MTTRFNLRVYAIIIRDQDILLTDESINGFNFTKFPGGGVEPGEGLADALKRELREEGELEVLDMEHFYTTDFFQPSAFDAQDQIISVYYKVKIDVAWKEFSSDQSSPDRNHQVRLYFYPLSELEQHKLTFPIDKYVLNLIKQA